VLLNLGRVEGVAEVLINGISLGIAAPAPHLLDISTHVRPGQNRLEVMVTPPLRNALVGRGLAEDPLAENMKVFEGRLAPAGLMGPVVITRYPPPAGGGKPSRGQQS
jgi:hypothetical protein